MLVLMILFIRSLLSRQTAIGAKLFCAALKNENSGHYEEAIVDYEKALIEAKKTRYNKMQQNKIVEKISLLHTVIQYQNSFICVKRILTM